LSFLPTSPKETPGNPDFVLVTGDAYVDHPSFGAAIIGRLLESRGYSVGVIAAPDYRDAGSFGVFGRPRLAFLVTSGQIDSMVSNFTVARRPRARDVYAAGGVYGGRPDRALIVYCNKIRELYRDAAIIAGGLEASLRRLAHYDYWDNRVRRSVLLDSSADLIVYGMGERAMLESAEALDSGISIGDINFVKGTVYRTRDVSHIPEKKRVLLPDYTSARKDKTKYLESFAAQYKNTDYLTAKTLIEPYGTLFAVQNPPQPPLTEAELDDVYALPYQRAYHPAYEARGGVPAIEEVKFSITSARGCFGACNFCALSFHQGRRVASRSHESIIKEAEAFTREADFKGYIHDVGGPTANFRRPACRKQEKYGVCAGKRCLFPRPCENLEATHGDYLALLRRLREIPGVKKVFIRSGIRYDYLMADGDGAFLRELAEHHVSGQLKVAPEHVSPAVLERMGKPAISVFNEFKAEYDSASRAAGKEQYLVPYFMSSHPGSGLKEAVELACWLREAGFRPEQVQDFYPTPGTLSTCMYYTGMDLEGKAVYSAATKGEKALQRALMQYFLPQNYELAREALIKAGRQDLIGYGEKCLLRPRQGERPPETAAKPAAGAAKRKKKTIRSLHKSKKNRRTI
jgi:uncharacterized radical SAM protein YgiQ